MAARRLRAEGALRALTASLALGELLQALLAQRRRLRVAQQWNADAEIEYLETDSEYSYRL